MGYLVRRLERQLRSNERKLERTEAKMAALRQRQAEGRISKGKMESRMQRLEMRAKHYHGTISTIQGNLRKQKVADRKAAA